jgi:hypothetical protein
MPIIITRESAWELLTEFTQSESLRKHALAVEGCMRAYARKFGKEPERELDREGHDFSRADKSASLNLALAAEGRLASGGWPSGAEALNTSGGLDGTAEAVPFPISPTTGNSVRSYEEPSEADRYQMIRTYFRMLIEEELPDAVGKMKQFASWFTHGVPGGSGLRKAIYESKSAVEILGRIEEFFEAKQTIHATVLIPH